SQPCLVHVFPTFPIILIQLAQIFVVEIHELVEALRRHGAQLSAGCGDSMGEGAVRCWKEFCWYDESCKVRADFEKELAQEVEDHRRGGKPLQRHKPDKESS